MVIYVRAHKTNEINYLRFELEFHLQKKIWKFLYIHFYQLIITVKDNITLYFVVLFDLQKFVLLVLNVYENSHFV